MELLVSLALGLSVWFLLPGERPALVERSDRGAAGRDSGVFELPPRAVSRAETEQRDL